MAAIYRFGFELGVPSGVTVAGTYTKNFSPRYGTTGCSGSVTCSLASELAVKGSFELFLLPSTDVTTLLAPATLVAIGNVTYILKNDHTIAITVNSNVVSELAIPTVTLGHLYEVRFCYVAGSAGMCIFEWDGNELTFDADVSTAITAGVTSVTLGSSIQNNHVIDNVAINNASGDADNDIPPMTASFYAVPAKVGDKFDWSIATGYDAVTAVTTGGYIYSNTVDATASYFLSVPGSDITRVTFEGLRVTFDGLRRTGAVLNQGLELGYIVDGENVKLGQVPKLSYSAQTRTYTILYDQYGDKISLAHGDTIQPYLKVYNP